MEHFRVPAPPFAVFDEFGAGADDRVQDYAQRLVDAAVAAVKAAHEADDDFSPAEFAAAIRLMQERRVDR